MKVKMYCFLAILSGLLWITVSAEEPKTFTVKDGAAPWNDRENSTLEGLPERLKGDEALPQQSCSSRSIVVPGTPKLLVIGVYYNDMPLFHEKYPKAQATGEIFNVAVKNGNAMRFYVVTLAGTASIPSAGYQSGLVLLKIDNDGNSPQLKDPVVEWPKVGPEPFMTGEKGKLHIYLLMGQSNMLGRDTSTIFSQNTEPRIGYIDGRSRWFVAVEPMHAGGTGVGPGISFAREMLKDYPDGKIGLVPCAVGGSPLKSWMKGAVNYENTLKLAKLAMSAGVLEGILWHQGENDSDTAENADTYETRLVEMFKTLRADLGSPDLPIVLGQLGEFFKAPKSDVVKAAIERIPKDLPFVGFADSKGLQHKGDNLHFNVEAEQQLGRRYAEAMQKLKK
jgi:hypothetical protein